METKTDKHILQGQIGEYLDGIVGFVNNMDNDADKAVLLEKLRSVLNELNNNIGENINFVAQKTITDFFRTHSQYNNFLEIVDYGGGIWLVRVFGIPVCVVSCTAKEAGYYSMDSIRGELSRLEWRYQENTDKTKKALQKVNNILAMSGWEMFLNDLKHKSLLTPSLISKGRKALQKMRETLSQELDKHKENYQKIHYNKELFVDFIDEISTYLYEGFTKEGYGNQIKNIEPYCYDFNYAISLFMEKRQFNGAGLTVLESETYAKQEKLGWL